MNPIRFRWPAVLWMTGLSVSTLAVSTLAGCADPQPSPSDSMEARQNAALSDPFSYGQTPPPAGAPVRPGQPEPLIKPRDESLKGDWNRFWNP